MKGNVVLRFLRNIKRKASLISRKRRKKPIDYENISRLIREHLRDISQGFEE